MFRGKPKTVMWSLCNGKISEDRAPLTFYVLKIACYHSNFRKVRNIEVIININLRNKFY